MPFDSPSPEKGAQPDPLSVRPSRTRRAPDEASRILLAVAETIERGGYEHGWQVSHAIRKATERETGLGPVSSNVWFERTLGRLFRHERTKLPGKRTPADWASRCRAAAELEPLEDPRWPPYEGW